tara:strand:+ start:581 stop:1060 length:480 start_codon:yes stop_codon:yes gene_type:complete
MFERKSSGEKSNSSDNNLDVFRPTKGSAKVVIGNGVKIKGEITNADEVQIDGEADVAMNTENLLVGGTGNLKGNIVSENADIWGKLEGDVKISGTLTIQEQGNVEGTIEYQNLQIKLGGKLRGEIKVSDKVKKMSDHIKNDNKEGSSSLQEATKDKKST